MTLCKGLKPGDGKRLQAHAQRCGALAEPNEELCAVHLKAGGRRRCAKCGAWTNAGGGFTLAHVWAMTVCPNGCVEPGTPAADEHARILAETESRNRGG